MPSFDGAPFIRRAVSSVVAQTVTDGERSSSSTARAIAPMRSSPRSSPTPDARSCAGRGIEGSAPRSTRVSKLSKAPFVSYLPSDDVLYPEHLASLLELLQRDEEAIVAFSGARHHGRKESSGEIAGYGLQLVQVLQRRTPDRWLERDELVTDDLERMLWSALRRRGRFVGSQRVTCEWTDHPMQRHKLIRESLGGGVNVYRRHYQVRGAPAVSVVGGGRIHEGRPRSNLPFASCNDARRGTGSGS